MQEFYGLSPIVTSQAGSVMTCGNWQEAGIKILNCQLEMLLIKPGMNVLKQCKSLHHYLGWEGAILLDARLPAENKEGLIKLKSPYDGTTVVYSLEDIQALIAHLGADYVLDDNQSDLGILSAELSLTDMLPWVAQGRTCFSQDLFAVQACQGLVLSSEGLLDLKDLQWSHDFEVIDSSCSCPVCRQSLTRAYLHHLFSNTPLLCQRYLTLHNAAYIQASLLGAG